MNMEQIDVFFGRCFDVLKENPRYGLLVAMVLVTIYLLGLILNWKWTLLPGSSSDLTPLWVEMLGEKTVRIGKAIIAVFLIFCLLYLYIKL